jgi:hypothetical protein
MAGKRPVSCGVIVTSAGFPSSASRSTPGASISSPYARSVPVSGSWFDPSAVELRWGFFHPLAS